MPACPPPHRADRPFTMQAFVREHGGRIRAWLRRFGVPESDLDDACQEVLLVVHRHRDELGDAAAQRGWLYTVCRRTARDLRRRAHRRHEQSGACPSVSRPASQHAAVEARQQLAIVQRAAAELSPELREAWLLATLSDVPTATLAERLGCAHKTVFSRLYAAREQLRRRLSAEGWLGAICCWQSRRELGVPRVRSWLRPDLGSLATAALAGMLVIGEAPMAAVPALATLVTNPARLTAPSEPAHEARRVSFSCPAPEAPSAARAPTLRTATAPTTTVSAPSAGAPDMVFDVQSVAEPDAALALQQVAFMEFQPVVAAAASPPQPQSQRIQRITHPPAIKPRLSRPFTRRAEPRGRD